MAKALIVIGSILLVLGGVAAGQSADSSLRFFPALILPWNKQLVAGPDLPPHLTTLGIVVVYFLPGALLLALGVFISKRRASMSTRGAITSARDSAPRS